VMSLVKALMNMLRILSWTMFISIFFSLFCILLFIFMFSASILVNKAVYYAWNFAPYSAEFYDIFCVLLA